MKKSKPSAQTKVCFGTHPPIDYVNIESKLQDMHNFRWSLDLILIIFNIYTTVIIFIHYLSLYLMQLLFSAVVANLSPQSSMIDFSSSHFIFISCFVDQNVVLTCA
jgi:hypothetical protein